MTISRLLGAAAALAIGASFFAVSPASAGVGVSIGIGLGGPGYYGAAPLDWRCQNPNFRFRYPAYCAQWSPYDYGPYFNDAFVGDLYYGPVFVGGAWYHGPYRWRSVGSEREFFVNGSWRRNEWRREVPRSIEFHNGGYYREGRYGGFANADRINRDVRSGRRDLRADQRVRSQDAHDLASDRNHGAPARDVRQDRRNLSADHRDIKSDRRDLRRGRPLR